MRTLFSLFVALACLGSTLEVTADTVTASEDTWIHEFSDNDDVVIGLPPNEDFLFAIEDATPFDGIPLVKFDLSAYAGMTVTSAGTFELFLLGEDDVGGSTDGGTAANATPRTVSVHEIFVNWGESTTTWNNFGNPPGPGPDGGTDYDLTAAGTSAILYNGGSDTYVSWTIPASLIQFWIDNPGNNDGLLVDTQSGDAGNALVFATKEHPSGNPPLLTFDVIPEASSFVYAISGLGVLGWLLWRRSRRQVTTSS